MKPLAEHQSVEATRNALEPYRIHEWNAVHYLWEVVGVEKVCWDDTASMGIERQEECILVFDSNAWNMPARLEAARIASSDEAHVGYRCTGEEVQKMFSQPWTSNADFYVLSADGRFIGMRTHEDTGSASGMWIPKKPEPIQRGTDNDGAVPHRCLTTIVRQKYDEASNQRRYRSGLQAAR